MIIEIKEIDADDVCNYLVLVNGINTSLFYTLEEALEYKSFLEERQSLSKAISHLKGENQEIYARLLDNGYYVSLRKGRLRISPHLYNTMDEIDAVLDLLRSCT